MASSARQWSCQQALKQVLACLLLALARQLLSPEDATDSIGDYYYSTRQSSVGVMRASLFGQWRHALVGWTGFVGSGVLASCVVQTKPLAL
jgi:hypothetical protein